MSSISATGFLPFHRADVGDDEIAAVVDAIRSGWLTTGPRVKEFEAAFARYVGAKHAVALNSCTAALHLALDGVGVREGDEVIVPTMTFAATAEVVLYQRARPVLVDCEPDTLNIDVAALERAITPKTKAIVPVHFGGQACEMDAILDLARRHGLAIVEDAAHSLPASYCGRTIGTLGDVTCFSFYATKTLTTGEGGMATTDSDDYADRMRIMSLHGISRDAWKRYTADGTWRYDILEAGFKYNMTDIAAAIGIVQLKKCDEMRRARSRIARLYTEAFRDVPAVRVPVSRPDREHAWHLYVIQIDDAGTAVSRDDVILRLKEHGIGTSVHFIPLHLHPLYRDRFGYRAEDFPAATAAFSRILSLPIYPGLSDGDVANVVESVKASIGRPR